MAEDGLDIENSNILFTILTSYINIDGSEIDVRCHLSVATNHCLSKNALF